MTTRKMTKLDWKVTERKLELAREVAEELTDALAATEPVDPFAIADGEREVLSFICDDFRNRFDGQLEFHADKRRFLMFVNTKYDAACLPGEHHPRTRFSAAHELGHFYINHHRACLIKGARPHPSHSEFTSEAMMEREADSFAAALLMPSRLMRPLVNDSELTLSTINELADRFQTSRVSTAIRAVLLSDFPVAVAGIRDGRIKWSSQAECLVPAGCYPPERGPITSSGTRKRWEAFLAGDNEQTTGQAYVDEWFRTYGCDHLMRLPVTEYHLAIPAMDTLVVLLTVPEEELFPDSDDD